MFHLIKKYSNRKLYDTFLKRFITLDELITMLMKKEELRIEDSDSHVDITDLEISKAIMRYINEGNDLPDALSELFHKISENKLPKRSSRKISIKKKKSVSQNLEELEGEEEVMSYVPAEIRLLNKSLQYLQGAISILKNETPFNSQLHDELYVNFTEFERKLNILKKKHRIS